MRASGHHPTPNHHNTPGEAKYKTHIQHYYITTGTSWYQSLVGPS